MSSFADGLVYVVGAASILVSLTVTMLQAARWLLSEFWRQYAAVRAEVIGYRQEG